MFAKQSYQTTNDFGNFNNFKILKGRANGNVKVRHFNECCCLLEYISYKYLQYINVIKIQDNFVIDQRKTSKPSEKPSDALMLIIGQILNLEVDKLKNYFINEDYWRVVDLNNLFNDELIEETMIKKCTSCENWKRIEKLVHLFKHNGYYFNDASLFDPKLKKEIEYQISNDKGDDGNFVLLKSNKMLDLGVEYFTMKINTFTNITLLDLSENEITDEGIRLFSDVLKYFNILRFLILESNHVSSKGLNYIIEKINFIPELHYLNICSNRIDDNGLIALSQNLNCISDLTYLNISHNLISDRGFKVLCQNLSCVTDLMKLSFHSNIISNYGFNCFLNQNSYLRNMHFVVSDYNNGEVDDDDDIMTKRAKKIKAAFPNVDVNKASEDEYGSSSDSDEEEDSEEEEEDDDDSEDNSSDDDDGNGVIYPFDDFIFSTSLIM